MITTKLTNIDGDMADFNCKERGGTGATRACVNLAIILVVEAQEEVEAQEGAQEEVVAGEH